MNLTEKRKAEQFISEHLLRLTNRLRANAAMSRRAYKAQPLPPKIQDALDKARLIILGIEAEGFTFTYEKRNACPPEDAAKITWPTSGTAPIIAAEKEAKAAAEEWAERAKRRVWSGEFATFDDLEAAYKEMPLPEKVNLDQDDTQSYYYD